MFVFPRVETALGNLCRVRRVLDKVARHRIGAIAISFRMTLWPSMEPLPHSTTGHSCPSYCKYLHKI